MVAVVALSMIAELWYYSSISYPAMLVSPQGVFRYRVRIWGRDLYVSLVVYSLFDVLNNGFFFNSVTIT